MPQLHPGRKEIAAHAMNSEELTGNARNTRFATATHLAFLVTKIAFDKFWRTGMARKSREKCGKLREFLPERWRNYKNKTRVLGRHRIPRRRRNRHLVNQRLRRLAIFRRFFQAWNAVYAPAVLLLAVLRELRGPQFLSPCGELAALSFEFK